jgi:Trypsin-like peptidase domain
MLSVRYVNRCTGLAVPAFFCLLGALSTARSDPLPDGGEMRESVVRILAEGEQGTATGTGFIINNRRAIATNNHVIDGAKTISVAFLAAGRPTLVPAHLVAADPTKDIALIETDTDIFGEPVLLANYETNPPAKVTAVGYPGAADDIAGGGVANVLLEPSYSVGAVARILSDVKDMGGDRVIQHTATVNPGNSGGPLFDECGRVIGINTLRVVPNENNEYAQGIFYSVDIRELFPMLEENLVQARIADKPCTPGLDTRNDVAPAATKEAEAVAFDRFTACINARPCDGNICKSRYLRRVTPQLAGARQADVDLRMAASGPLCTQQKEAEAYGEFLGCANNNPCDFDQTCEPKLVQSQRPEIMQKRHPLVERLRAKAQDECKQASAPGVWHAGQVKENLWSANVSNESGAGIFVACVIGGNDSGNGVFEIDNIKNGKRERWAGTRSVRMTVDTYSEPLRLDLDVQDGKLDAVIVHKETDNDRGWLKELIGKLSVGGVATFEEPQIGLDETFSLNGAREALDPCLKAKYASQQAQDGQQQQ